MTVLAAAAGVPVQRVLPGRAPRTLEFTHFLSEETRLTPINKG